MPQEEGDELRVHAATNEADDTISPPLVVPHAPTPNAQADEVSWSWRQLWALTGAGGAITAAFVDPHTLEMDLQLGAYTKYSLLYVVLLTTAMSLGVQVLAARLGASTRKHLAELCRAEYVWTYVLPLWGIVQGAITVRNAQHVASTAMALETLTGVPKWIGCVLTAGLALALLGFRCCDDARARFPASRAVEMVFLCLLSMLGVLCVANLSASGPSIVELAKGVFQPHIEVQDLRRAFMRCTVIVVPFNLFLHSALTSQCSIRSRVIGMISGSATRANVQRRQHRLNVLLAVETMLAMLVVFLIHAAVAGCFASAMYSPQCARLSRADSASSLAFTRIQTTCVPIRAALASHKPVYDAFSGNVCKFGGPGMVATPEMMAACTSCNVERQTRSWIGDAKPLSHRGYCQEIDLSDAGNALREAIGSPIQTVWALSVLVSGLMASLATTLAGEFVLQGFLGLSRAPGIQRPVAQAITVIPGAILAATIAGVQTSNLTWQNILYAVPALAMPLVLIALLSFTNSGALMTPRFANSRFISRLLLLCIALISSLQLGFLYDRLSVANVHPSVVGWIVIGIMIALYCAMLLYAVLCYRSTSDRERSRQEEAEAQFREPLLADDEVAV